MVGCIVVTVHVSPLAVCSMVRFTAHLITTHTATSSRSRCQVHRAPYEYSILNVLDHSSPLTHCINRMCHNSRLRRTRRGLARYDLVSDIL